jgi:hypothetical protein
MRGAVLVCLGLIGCGPPVGDPEAFEAEFAARWCDRQEECALGEFERHFSSFDDCVDDKEDDLDIPAWDAGCEVDRDGGTRCLEYLDDTDCAGWEDKRIEEECVDAYDC